MNVNYLTIYQPASAKKKSASARAIINSPFYGLYKQVYKNSVFHQFCKQHSKPQSFEQAWISCLMLN